MQLVNKKEEKILRSYLTKRNHPFPELKRFLANPESFLKKKYVKDLMKDIKNKSQDLASIPITSQRSYDQYEIDGDRETYDIPHHTKRENLSICVLYFLLGHKKYLNLIEDYLGAICDEHTWVMPCHKGRIIDLYSASDAILLSEIIFILREVLNSEIYDKVYQTINERIFIPYLDKNIKHRWYKNNDNWNAVCNSEIASAFLLIEKDNTRTAHAIKKALEGLEVYISESFKDDGSTEEGIHYWNYGISNFIVFSEILSAVTKNEINLLNNPKIKKIVKFPSKIQLSLGVFASFSDSSGTEFHPGIIQKLSERTNDKSLLGLIWKPPKIDWFYLFTVLRYILWWDGRIFNKVKIEDSILPDTEIVRLVNKSVVMICKAGDNGENHNHNDVGSFILNISGENFVTDPGSGLYSKGYHDYKNLERYKNIFTNSYGHSVPRIDNQLQSPGKKFSGKIMSVKKDDDKKTVNLKISGAYDIPCLKNLTRKISINDDKVLLKDDYLFTDDSLKIEEAFITWLDVVVKKNTAVISGKNHKLVLTIRKPKEMNFRLEKLEKVSRENKKSGILKRISFVIPKTRDDKINVEVEMTPQ